VGHTSGAGGAGGVAVLTVTAGEVAIAPRMPPAVDFSLVVNVAVPAELCAVAPSTLVQLPPEVAP
jgi:hypothetical protein